MVNGQPVSIMQDRIKSMLVDEKSDKVVVENGKCERPLKSKT